MADTAAGRRTFRVWRVQSVEPTDQPAVRPSDFDLATAWEEIVATVDERRGLRVVSALADPELVRWLRVHFGTRLTVGALEDGRVEVDIGFPETYDDPARELSGHGDGLEVLGPPEVRARLAEIGVLLVANHSGSAAARSGTASG